jgi:hypothetical protein
MAARRLLIVMLVLLGISTLAAALVPQHALRSPNTRTATTTTTPARTTTPAAPALPTRYKLLVPGKKGFPVIPVHVGDQFRVLARSRFPTQLSIPSFGLVGFAAPNAPAIFNLLPESPGRFGVVFEPSGKVVARICAFPRNAKLAKQRC